jgi:hypothetical protein
MRIARNISEYRVAAYECAAESSGIVKGKRIAGWYGMFDEARLRTELVPKLAEYVIHDASYPFLITSYRLVGKTDFRVEPDRHGRHRDDVKFTPRRRSTPHQYEAVVHSGNSYELLR